MLEHEQFLSLQVKSLCKKMARISISVPSKAIISGEHAVVYGVPAIVAGVGVYSDILLEENTKNTIEINLNTYHYSFELEEVKTFFKLGINKQLHLFQDDRKSAIGLLVVLQEVIDYFGIELAQGFTLSISSPIDPGSGLGFSASYASGIAYCIASLYKHGVLLKDLEKILTKTESYFHGNPSGVDQAAVLHGGIFQFVKGKEDFQFIDAAPSFLENALLIYTGKPKSSTKESVEAVASFLNGSGEKEEILGNFAKVVSGIKKSIKTGDELLFIEHVNANHSLLSKIGVSSVFADEICKKVMSVGGACKVTGAGSAKGDSVGMLYALGNTQKIKATLSDHDLHILQAPFGVKGVKDIIEMV